MNILHIQYIFSSVVFPQLMPIIRYFSGWFMLYTQYTNASSLMNIYIHGILDVSLY